MAITQQQRFTRDHRCPVCGGYETLERGTGRRCYGFLSESGDWAHCTRPEYARGLVVHPGSETFAHRLTGECKCGQTHDAVPPLPAGMGAAHWRRRTTEQQLGSWDCTYTYRDASGTPLHRTVRFRDPKSFRQQRYANGEWHWGLGNVEPVLYRLPELLAADPALTVCLVEGEKDAERLAALGFVATTTVCGTARWQERYTRWLSGRDVLIMADNDEPGLRRGARTLAALRDACRCVSMARVAGRPGADISDWLDAGGQVDELRRLASGVSRETRMEASA